MYSYDEYKAIIEKHLLDYIPKIDTKAKILFDSMKYSVMGGGKRLRPVMLLAASHFSKNSKQARGTRWQRKSFTR